MRSLSQLSYEEFGELLFLDHFPRTSAYEEDNVGGIDYGAGYACKAGYVWTLFASKTLQDGTSVILLDFSEDCPEEEGNALLTHLGLNLRKGIDQKFTLQNLGIPEEPGHNFIRFVIGQQWPYYVGCSFHDNAGLFRVWIARKDLADIWDAI